MHAVPGHVTPGRRASLVDAVMDLPDVQESARLEAAIPLGDSETLERLRERSENATTRAAGASALLDADIPDPAVTSRSRPLTSDRPPTCRHQRGDIPSPSGRGCAAPPGRGPARSRR